MSAQSNTGSSSLWSSRTPQWTASSERSRLRSHRRGARPLQCLSGSRFKRIGNIIPKLPGIIESTDGPGAAPRICRKKVLGGHMTIAVWEGAIPDGRLQPCYCRVLHCNREPLSEGMQPTQTRVARDKSVKSFKLVRVIPQEGLPSSVTSELLRCIRRHPVLPTKIALTTRTREMSIEPVGAVVSAGSALSPSQKRRR